MYFQNDLRWKNEFIGHSKTSTIGEVGCLLTALCNIYLRRFNKELTPKEANDRLNQLLGFTDGNLILWDKTKSVFGWDSIDINYKGELNYSLEDFYIVNYFNGSVGHFTNLILHDRDLDDYHVFDVWDNKFKVKQDYDIRRIVKISYKAV